MFKDKTLIKINIDDEDKNYMILNQYQALLYLEKKLFDEQDEKIILNKLIN